MKVLIATGGTGGHICCALAIAEQLQKMKQKVFIIGSKSGMDKTMIPDIYSPMFTVQKPLLGRGIREKLLFPFFLCYAILQTFFIIRALKPSVVIGTGGFASFPCVFLASMIGLPTIITEIDSVPGLTTKALAPFVYEIWLAFPSAKQYLCGLSRYGGENKVRIAGFPIREAIFKAQDKQPETKNILVFGGSRGAHSINKIISEVVKRLPDIHFIWIAGQYEKFFSQCDTNSTKHSLDLEKTQLKNVELYKFVHDMGSVYKNAQLVISRAGALTIGELIATELPSILIPYPYATKQHQLLNAKYLAKTGGAKIIKEKDLTVDLLTQEIKNLFAIDKNGISQVQKMRFYMQETKKRYPQNTSAMIARKVNLICKKREKDKKFN